MWKTKDCTGQEQIWYEGKLIEEIKYLCKRRPYQALDKILELIKENEGC